MWLNGVVDNGAASEYVVVYDRRSTQQSGLFKLFNLSLVTAPVTQTGANGATIATETMATVNSCSSKRCCRVNPRRLLQRGAQSESDRRIGANPFIYGSGPIDPAEHALPTRATGRRQRLTMAAATYVQSTSGTAFDGAVFGGNAVFFPVSSIAPFAGISLPVPTGIHSVMVAGLAANAGYAVNVSNGALTISFGGASIADSAGLLKITL